MWRELLALVASGLALVQVVPYLISIIRRRTKVSLTSYLIWAAVEVQGAAAYVLMNGAAPATWPRIAFSLTGLCVLILALRLGQRAPVTTFEKVSLVVAVVAGVVWAVSRSPLVSLYVSVLVSVIAYGTTLRKLHAMPGTEDPTSWALTSAASALNVAVLTSLAPNASAIPVVSLAGSGAVVALIWWQTRTKSRVPVT